MQTYFQFAAAAAQVALIAYLWRIQLLVRFPFLATFFATQFLWALVTAVLSKETNRDYAVWETFVVATSCSMVAAFLETIYLSLEHYPGLSRQAVIGACGVIGAISAILGALEPTYHQIRGLLVAQRVLGLAIAVSAVGLALMLNYFDPRRRQNVVRHERIMAAMAANSALAAWLHNHELFAWGVNLLDAGSIVFPALWIWALRAKGEVDTRPPSNPAGRDQARAASDQLREYYE